jgi:hypothetical protein
MIQHRKKILFSEGPIPPSPPRNEFGLNLVTDRARYTSAGLPESDLKHSFSKCNMGPDSF